MFELLLVACVGLRSCEYIVAPSLYESERVCLQQAALLAGMVRGHYAPGEDLRYTPYCQKVEHARFQFAEAIPPPAKPDGLRR